VPGARPEPSAPHKNMYLFNELIPQVNQKISLEKGFLREQIQRNNAKNSAELAHPAMAS
jgi:hypothetical protein